MVAANLKKETKSLMGKRDALEGEMNIIISRLCQPGGPGISGNLVDSEGFPRSDIDIPSVRADRSRLSELRNDYADITSKIDQNLQTLHSVRLAPKTSAPPKSSAHAVESNDGVSYDVNAVAPASSQEVLPKDTPSAMSVDSVATVPFAVVDEIADASPAAEDGLQLGDQLVKFGNVEFGDNLVPSLVLEGQTNQGRAIPVFVLRQGGLINLTVTPRPWNGQGLLGCHFRIL